MYIQQMITMSILLVVMGCHESKSERKLGNVPSPRSDDATTEPDLSQKIQPKSDDQNDIANSPRFSVKCEKTNGKYKYCYEWEKVPELAFTIAQDLCSQEIKGIFTGKEQCSREDNVGGCTQGNGAIDDDVMTIDLVVYYYAPHYTTEKVKKGCEVQKESYVDP